MAEAAEALAEEQAVVVVLEDLHWSDAAYHPQRHRSPFSYGVDPWVASRGYTALALWLLGFMRGSFRTRTELSGGGPGDRRGHWDG